MDPNLGDAVLRMCFPWDGPTNGSQDRPGPNDPCGAAGGRIAGIRTNLRSHTEPSSSERSAR
jgi:hypothetical protein